MSLENEDRYAELGKTAAQPYIDGECIDVPLQTMLARIEEWVQQAVFAWEKANRMQYQQAFIYELREHGVA